MILLDSSVLVAALSAKDANHDRAKAVLAEVGTGLWGHALVPDWIFVEVSSFVLRKFGRSEALRVAASLVGRVDSTIIPCSGLFDRALQIFTARGAPGLSFADAGVVAVAEMHGVRNLATYDTAFRAFPSLNIVVDARQSA